MSKKKEPNSQAQTPEENLNQPKNAPEQTTGPTEFFEEPEDKSRTFVNGFGIALAGIALVFGGCFLYDHYFKQPPVVDSPSSQVTSSFEEGQTTETPAPVPSPAPAPTPQPEATSASSESSAANAPVATTAPTATPAPRLKEKTVVRANPSSPDIKGLYGAIYCPTAGLDTNVFMGDDELTMTNGFGQQSDTFQIGYESSHLLWTSNANYAYDMTLMNVGDRMQIETSYGTYVYEVQSVDHGFRDKIDGKIYTEDGHEIADIYTVDDSLYLAYQHSDGKIDVITCGIIL